MKTATLNASAGRLSWSQAIIAVAGVFYTLTGLALLFAPVWFYQNIGNFPPFNRHFLGDLGTFTLPMGIALLWAARQPAAHRLTIALATVASLLHALNHAYDDWLARSPLGHWFGETIPLLLFAILLLLACRNLAGDRPAG